MGRRRVHIWLFTLCLPLLLATHGFAASVVVSWDPNTESDLSGYKVYYGNASRNYPFVIDVGNVTSYTVQNLQDGMTYYFAVTAYDFAGNESAFSEEVSIALNTGGVDTNPPELVSVVVMGQTQLDVIFSEPVEQSSAENPANYSISNGVGVLTAILDQNPTTVHLLTTRHQRGTTYVLSVSNVKDLAQNSIASGSSLSYTIPNGGSEDTDPPQLVLAIIKDETHVDVIFNEPIEQSSAEEIGNYSISGGVQVQQATLSSNNVVVQLLTTAHQRDVVYTLTVSNIRDRAANPNVIAPNSSVTYQLPSGGGDADTIPPQLIAVKVNGATQIDVNFSEPVERASAENTNNYSIKPGIEVLGAVLDPNQTTVHLVTTPHQKGINYTLTVRDIKDQAPSPNIMPSSNSLDYTYDAGDSDVDPGNSGGQTPSSFVLFQNYPNPFNPETEIRFFLNKSRMVSVNIYNTRGQRVRTLVDGRLQAGFHTLVWNGTNDDGKNVPSGVYIYALEVRREADAGDVLVSLALERRVMKMTLIR